MKHLLKMLDLSKEEIIEILNLADQLKYENKNGIEHHLLKGKTLGMIFQKASTRTRVSFETGMYQLGGNPLFLSSNDLQIGRGERAPLSLKEELQSERCAFLNAPAPACGLYLQQVGYEAYDAKAAPTDEKIFSRFLRLV